MNGSWPHAEMPPLVLAGGHTPDAQPLIERRSGRRSRVA